MDGSPDDGERRQEALARLRPWVERTRGFSGWEFSAVRVRNLDPRPPWDYEATARKYAGAAAAVLDLGTGGGEVLSRVLTGLQPRPARCVASEEWVVNAPVARARLAPLGVSVVRCNSLRLPLADESFDLVLDRHEWLDPAEIARVLRPGGSLVTQQVARHDWRELRAYFPRMTSWEDHFSSYWRGLHAAGLRVEGQEHSRRVAYQTLGDVVYMLYVAPWNIPGLDIENEQDLAALLAFEADHLAEAGVVVTESRYLLVAYKP